MLEQKILKISKIFYVLTYILTYSKSMLEYKILIKSKILCSRIGVRINVHSLRNCLLNFCPSPVLFSGKYL